MRLILSGLFAALLAVCLPYPAAAQWAHQAPPQRLPQAAPQPAMPPAAPARPAPFRPNDADQRIAAVINDDVITVRDVEARMALAMLSSNLPNTAEVRQRLYPQILTSLVDEQLQLQEGKRLNITITQAEIDQALAKLSKENSIPGGDIRIFLASQGLTSTSLEAQARSALTWNKVALRSLRPRIDIGEDEIDSVIDRMRANEGKQESLVSEIFIAVNNPSEEDKARKFVAEVVRQIKSGAPFGALARQFSQGSSAASGGDIGWIQAGQLAPELDQAIKQTDVGQLSEPVRTANGFHIMGVRDRRLVSMGDPGSVSVDLQQIFRPFGGGFNKNQLLREASSLRSSITGCDNLPARIKQEFSAWRWQDLGQVNLATAPSWISTRVKNLQVGQSSEPMATDKGALILFVCGRDAKETVNRDIIMNTIGMERMDLMSKRLLRDLRRSAHLDIRVPTN
jgi:peptidyl-prolyl cis-trans isomerase SurA